MKYTDEELKQIADIENTIGYFEFRMTFGQA